MIFHTITVWRIELHTSILPYFADVAGNKRTMISYAQKIGKYDSDFADKYVRDDKRKTLESEISSLKYTISHTSTEATWKGGLIGCAVIMFICGFIGFAVMSAVSFGALLGIFGFGVGAIEVYAARPNKEVIEKNKAIVAKAKTDLAKKEAELATL